jgi:cytochrome c peroxidase
MLAHRGLTRHFLLASLLLAAVAVPGFAAEPVDVAIPNEKLKIPFASDAPIVFVSRAQSRAEWEKLPSFWNEASETVPDPKTGQMVTRRVVKLKIPLGIAQAPAIPTENPLTVAKWELGKKLYFDKILSSDSTVSCASCHDPKKGFGDASKTSVGIKNQVGGMNAPTVLNSGFNRLQFWDGRAASLEEQAQGPVGNPIEMFSGKGEPWAEAVARLRAKPEYMKAFEGVFGHGPTRDAAAKAIATYERTVIIGNSLFDRAEQAMRVRVAEEEGKLELKAVDFAKVLTAAFAAKDKPALAALGLDVEKDAAKAGEIGTRLVNGRNIYFGKARCSNCHVGDNFTDNSFHNLGVGVKDGKLDEADYGRFARLATGHKDYSQIGAFKTPGLRGLLDTAPYMHDGSEKTLEAVVDFYDRGGNANEFLDPKMRDTDAELAYIKAQATGKPYEGPKPALLNRSGLPIIPFQLKLTPQEKADLVLFMKSLQSDPVDPTVADPTWFPAAK